MNVLLVRKTTNYELHGLRTEMHVQSGHLDAGNLEKLKKAHDQHYRCLDTVRVALEKTGLPWFEITRDQAWPSEKIDKVITIGGDGTLLSASHAVSASVDVMGVRSSASSVGYLCGYDYMDSAKVVGDLEAGKLDMMQVQRIKAKISKTDLPQPFETAPVLNEFLFANISPAATSRYKITLGGHSEFHKSSGIWVSTAIGSSAAIHAAGGELLDKHDRLFQYRVREMYNSQGLNFRLSGGPFDPDVTSLSVENRNEHALLAIDGQHGEVGLGFGDRVEFLRAEPLNIAVSASWNLQQVSQ